jgi:hypothetical protein
VTRPYLEDTPSVPAGFDFDLIGASLAGVLEQPADGATVVGVHGPWGSGKTTLMYAIRDALRKRCEDREPVLVEFNAWKYQDREALWRALILLLIAELRKEPEAPPAELDHLESSLYRAFELQEAGPWRINWRSAAIEAVTVGLELAQLGVVGRLVRRRFGRTKGDKDGAVLSEDDLDRISGVLERKTVTRHLAQVESIEQFLDSFKGLVEAIRGSRNRRIVVLVDDLDRCLPESALEVFEAIKLFLDAPGCGFVVAIDREVIRRGLAVRYPPPQGSDLPIVDADEYIEKTIGVSYDVPRLSTADVDQMIVAAEVALPLDENHRKLIRKALGRNPRRVKRFLNLLNLQVELAARVGEKGHSVPGPLRGDGDPEALATALKTMLLGYRYPFLLRRGDDLNPLFKLQRIVTDYEAKKGDDPVAAEQERDAALAKLPAGVAALKGDRGLWNLMRLDPPLHLEPHRRDAIAVVNWFRRTGMEEVPD